MHTIIILESLSSVPLWAWASLGGYCLVQLALYWWGLPFAREQKAFVGLKQVSHGISNVMHWEQVYDIIYTAANAITVLGFAGLGVTAILVATGTYLPLVPFLFAASVGLSDVLDGGAAKRHEEHSLLGAAIDPIRDRLAIVLGAIAIIHVIGIDLWIVSAIPLAFFEAWIGNMGFRARRANKALNAHGSGKHRQMTHLAVIGLLLTAFYLAGDISTASAQVLSMVGLLIMGLASGLAAQEYKRQSDLQ